ATRGNTVPPTPAGRRPRWPARSASPWPGRGITPRAPSAIPGSATARRRRARSTSPAPCDCTASLACSPADWCSGCGWRRISRSPGEARRSRRREQCVEIEVPFQMIGEPVEGALDHRLVFEIARRGAEPGEKSAAELVAGEQPVQVAAGDPPVLGNGAIVAAGEAQHRTRETGGDGDPDMHLVAVVWRTAGDR